jgi:ribonuclease D
MQSASKLSAGSVVSVYVISTREEFLSACTTISQGLGPISIDAERASGFTYSQRAYLIQIYRRNAGTFLFDPPAIGSMSELMDAVGEQEWILHAASQDLACLREVGIDPPLIFDTELSARLLGLERVGLGAVVESLLGIHLAKEHSAVNWSTRPLPEPWLAYAAADVEHLVDVRDALSTMLIAEHKDKIAAAEFEATRTKLGKVVSAHPWRKLSGLHTLRQPKQLAVARELWFSRDALARERDISPGRLIPDSAILAAATALPTSSSSLIGLKAFNGRDARGSLNRWWNAVHSGLTTEDVPAIRIPTETLPAPRMWRDKNPEGYARLTVARHSVSARAREMNMPVENLLSPTALRQVAWSPPEPLSLETVSAALLKESARVWQIKETAQLVLDSFHDSERKLELILANENDVKTSSDDLT